MGYRSDVAAVIRVDKIDNAERVFAEFIGKVKLIGDDFFNDWNQNDYGWGENRFVFFVDGVKWYSDYDEVKAFNAIWELASNTEGLSGYFVRIGEEYDDIETDCFGIDPPGDEVCPVRSIHLEPEKLLGERNANAQEQTEQTPTA